MASGTNVHNSRLHFYNTEMRFSSELSVVFDMLQYNIGRIADLEVGSNR